MEKKYLSHVLVGSIPKVTKFTDNVVQEAEKPWFEQYKHLNEKFFNETEADAAQQIFNVVYAAIDFMEL